MVSLISAESDLRKVESAKMIFFTALESVSVLFILIVVGFVIGRKKLLSENSQSDLTSLVIYVTLPSSIISSMIRKFDESVVYELGIMIAISLAAYAFFVTAAYLITKRYKLPANQRDVLFIGACLSNISFMGFPVLETLYGTDILFYAAISQMIIFETFSWTFGVKILEQNVEGKGKSASILSIFAKPGLVAILIGLVIFVFQIKLPGFLVGTLKMTGAATSPMAMILVGLMLSKSNIKKAISNKYLYFTSAIKLILTPLTILFALNFIGIRGYALTVPTIELGMPTAAYLAMLSGFAKNDTSLASELVFLSSLLSILTIPAIVTLMEFISG